MKCVSITLSNALCKTQTEASSSKRNLQLKLKLLPSAS